MSFNSRRSHAIIALTTQILKRALLEERNALSLDTNQTSAVSRLMRRITRGNDAESSNSTGQDDTKDKLGTVSVPSPGVPRDIAVDLDCDVYSLVTDVEDDVSERCEEGAAKKRTKHEM